MKKEILISKIKQKCPLCQGSGFILRPRHSTYTLQQIKTAKKMYARGYTLRDIGKKIGVNHPQKVKNLIMRLSL